MMMTPVPKKKTLTNYIRFIGTTMKQIRAEQPELPLSEYIRIAMLLKAALDAA